MLNNQKPEPHAKGDGSTLDLHSVFYTIQGEGPFAGRPAIFVRLAGCNLQCPGCDTEYTQGRRTVEVDALVSQIEHTAQKPGTLIVLTGGEPLRQVVGKFCRKLNRKGFPVQIESNGVFSPDDFLAIMLNGGMEDVGATTSLVVSPKTKRINPLTAAYALCFKYVLDHRSVAEDGLPIRALEHPASTGVARPPEGFEGEIFLNPFDAKDDRENALNLAAVTKSCLEHGYRLGIQIHKLLGVE